MPLTAKDRLYSACAQSVKLYGIEPWSVKEDVIRLQRNDARRLHGCTILGENRISAEKLRTKMEEHEEEVFTGYKSAMVWSSRKNGRKYLVY